MATRVSRPDPAAGEQARNAVPSNRLADSLATPPAVPLPLVASAGGRRNLWERAKTALVVGKLPLGTLLPDPIKRIIERIESFGYVVEMKVHSDGVCMGALSVTEPLPLRMVKVNDTGDEAEYRCACHLARLLGIGPLDAGPSSID
jgi:hypothetical protein